MQSKTVSIVEVVKEKSLVAFMRNTVTASFFLKLFSVTKNFCHKVFFDEHNFNAFLPLLASVTFRETAKSQKNYLYFCCFSNTLSQIKTSNDIKTTFRVKVVFL